MKDSKFCNPTQETWFICWDDLRTGIRSYGSILPTQCLATFWNEIDYYLDESEWEAVLIANGIIITQPLNEI